ncbi:hypothetical protein Pint_31362 [Pistacia integerrima]|uniref:Uncharacterized protein n=1 Tax=Pistacia integerrima TaxID=434235 RepID=A0ACC0XTA3_9ROSI|nr:hypothetical protein Pint_31362 [Pistacia integerrima]
MASTSLLSISLSLLFLIFLSKPHFTLSLTNLHRPSQPVNSITDVHDLLPLYGLPKGILPGNVKSFTLANDTGAFSVELTSTCYVQFDQLVYYDKKIKGKLSYGAVSEVSGIQAKKLFLWLPVTGMEKVKGSDMVRFYVGALSEDLPSQQFQDIPVCKIKACSLRTNLASI